jgi:1,2-beta-oligoglucan phosphorylase
MEINNGLGLKISFLENGSIKSIEADPIRINLRPAALFSRSGTSLYLRKLNDDIEFEALIGPESHSRFAIDNKRYYATGHWQGFDYSCLLQLSENSLSWQWQVEIRNCSAEAIELDVVHVQDAGLKPVQSGLINEYYVSQYLERLVLENEKYGSVICCRQNVHEHVGNPWLMIACQNGAEAASVDGMQFFGKTYRETGIPEGLKSRRLGGEYAGESSVLALQEKAFYLKPGDSHRSVFVLAYLPDHPEATSQNDLNRLDELFSGYTTSAPETEKLVWKNAFHNLFNPPELLKVDDLNAAEITSYFGTEKRHPEYKDDKLLSFFTKGYAHVVLREKEILTDRPHGHIMQANAAFVPDESIVSTNAYACGVFNSHLTQGNTNFNILLSVHSNQFNQASPAGQRIFVCIEGVFYLLGIPSAFEMGLNYCKWIYKHAAYVFQVRTWTSRSSPQVNLDFKVISGDELKLLITHHFEPGLDWTIQPVTVAGTYQVKPGKGSMIERKFPQAQFSIVIQGDYPSQLTLHTEPTAPYQFGKTDEIFVLETKKLTSFCMSFIGEVCKPADAIPIDNPDIQFIHDRNEAMKAWEQLSLGLKLSGNQKDAAVINEILPWFGMNALTHYLTPYGLEQFGGAAWGTRDVSQGPVELLLNLEKYSEARLVLCKIFAHQNPDGGWPQWWMFDSYHSIRAHEAHGDIAYWCIIALCNYISSTGDYNILEEVLPYYHESGPGMAEKAPLSNHIERLIQMITGSFIGQTALVPFGGGDWNDSLQPVSDELARRLISSWTVQMNYQAFDQLADVIQHTTNKGQALRLREWCNKIKSDFNKYLVKDGIVAGYGLLNERGEIEVLLHPSDKLTGVSYSILPMNRGIISGIFSEDQAKNHQKLIEEQLKGPDGARLMDNPLKYSGGIQKIFQRAESSTFFGREIGLMYVHEHIRYAEALSRTGKAEEFVQALRQVIAISYNELVPSGDIRQANCYYSSSDIVFKNRYEADQRYHEIHSGEIVFRGGWRVYSSGPGIFIGLVISRLIGLRIKSNHIELDPVMPFSFNGTEVSLTILGHKVILIFNVLERNHSPKLMKINGMTAEFVYGENKYRKGGILLLKDYFLGLLDQSENLIEIVM